MKIKNKNRLVNGFSLIELLLTAGVLAFALSVVLVFFISCMVLNQANRNLSIATSHAESVVEAIKNTDFVQIAAKINNGVWNWDSANITQKGLTALNNESINTQVNGTLLLDVITTVNWSDGEKRSRSLNLETLIAEP